MAVELIDALAAVTLAEGRRGRPTSLAVP